MKWYWVYVAYLKIQLLDSIKYHLDQLQYKNVKMLHKQSNTLLSFSRDIYMYIIHELRAELRTHSMSLWTESKAGWKQNSNTCTLNKITKQNYKTSKLQKWMASTTVRSLTEKSVKYYKISKVHTAMASCSFHRLRLNKRLQVCLTLMLSRIWLNRKGKPFPPMMAE